MWGGRQCGACVVTGNKMAVKVGSVCACVGVVGGRSAVRVVQWGGAMQ